MDKRVTHNGEEIFYLDEGTGTPVMLIHGFAEDHSLWDAQTEYLGKNYRILVPDLPGSGNSPLPAGAGTTSMDELAEGIKAILDAEGIGHVVLIGHSMGGYITLAFAEKYPERLRASGLFHSTALADTEEKKATRRKGIEFIRKYGPALFIKQSTPNLFAESTRKEQPTLIDDLIARYSGFSPGSLIAYHEAMIDRPDRTQVLSRTTTPVLFIIGEQDTAVPLASILPQTHLPELAHIHILGNAGHMGMLEDPQVSNAILGNFLWLLR